MEIKDDVTAKEYFEEYVPKIFAEQVAGASLSGMDGTVIALQFDIVNGETQTYSLVVKDAKEVEAVAGPADGPLVTIELSEDVWRQAVTGKLEGATDMFTDVSRMSRARFDLIKDTKGTLVMDLSRPDGPNANINVTFNGAESPRAVFHCSLETWVKLNKGEIAGPTAFMSGQLKIEGDMGFAMMLGSMTG